MVRLSSDAKLNVLLTEDRPQAAEHWTQQLPRLLEPMGVASYLACSGHEAIRMAERVQFHAAVIDLGTPMGHGDMWSQPASATGLGNGGSSPAGLWLMQLLRRLPSRPPMVVVRGPAYNHFQVERVLGEALRLGAFSVVNKPVDLEQMLATLRRLIDRQYQGYWPPRQG